MKKIELTELEVSDLLDVCHAAARLHREFLMHDDWETGGDAASRKMTRDNQAFYVKQARKLRKKLQ